MRYFLLLLMTTASITTMVAQEVFTAHDLFKVNRVVDVAISPDGDHVAYLVQRYRPFEEGKGADYRDLYLYDREEETITPYLLGDRMLYDLQWHPGGQTITFLGRMDGEAQTTLYGINVGGGAYYAMADLPKSPIGYAWSPDGEKVAYMAITPPEDRGTGMETYGFDAEVFEEERSSRDLYVYDMASGASKKVNREGAVFAFAWHPEGRYIAAQIAPQNLVDDSYMFKDIYLLDTRKEAQSLWVDVPGKLSDMAWSPSGDHLAFISGVDINDPVSGSLFIAKMGEEKDFTALRNYTSGFEGHVSDVDWHDEETLLATVSKSTYTGIMTLDVETGEMEPLIPAGPYHIAGLEVSDRYGAFISDDARHPQEFYMLDIKKSEKERITFSNPWLEDKELGRQETISWKAKDGLRIDGVLIYPVDYEEGKKYPLIVEVHGGPEAHISDGWQTYYSRRGQIAAGRGYFVLYPNYRSSSGRGVAFSKMGFGDLADEEFTDILAGIDHLVEQGMVDNDKVGIGGGSYGGYFSAWAATKHSERFAAACPFVGISDQISKRNTTDIPYEDYYVHWGIWTYENFELVYDRSPVKYVRNNETPTLILHGKEDTRVHPSQSLELYRQLKIHGDAAVRLVWYPGEGHGNRNNPAQLDFCLRTMRWFDFYVKEGHDKNELPPIDVDYGLNLK